MPFLKFHKRKLIGTTLVNKGVRTKSEMYEGPLSCDWCLCWQCEESVCRTDQSHGVHELDIAVNNVVVFHDANSYWSTCFAPTARHRGNSPQEKLTCEEGSLMDLPKLCLLSYRKEGGKLQGTYNAVQLSRKKPVSPILHETGLKPNLYLVPI